MTTMTGNIKHKICIFVLIGLGLLLSSGVNAQFSVSERTFKKLNKAEKLMEQKDFKEALSLLQSLESSSENRKYELTLIYQAMGFLNYETSQYPKAIEYFEKSLALNASPEPVLQNIRLNLIQVHAIANNYDKAIQHFEAWIKKENSPSGDILALGGSLYAHVKQYDAAIKYLNQAIASSKTPNESWYQTLLSIHYEREDYKSATALLQKLVALRPDNKQYWTQLFSGYYLLNEYQKALSTLELAYFKKLLDKEEEIINLAKLYLYLGTPVKAVSLMKEEMNKGFLKSNEENLNLLANAYLQSRETEKSADTFLQLANSTGKPDLFLKSARLYMEVKRWNKVLTALDKAGNKVESGQSYLMKGMAYIELEDFEKATQAFSEAKKQADTKVSANQWLDFLGKQKLATSH
jgi:tetratricopeptide (TPR) repeat protein